MLDYTGVPCELVPSNCSESRVCGSAELQNSHRAPGLTLLTRNMKIQSVTKFIVLCLRKKRHNSFENQIVAIPLVVEFSKNIDFQRRYDAFSKTTILIILLHYVFSNIVRLLRLFLLACLQNK